MFAFKFPLVFNGVWCIYKHAKRVMYSGDVRIAEIKIEDTFKYRHLCVTEENVSIARTDILL